MAGAASRHPPGTKSCLARPIGELCTPSSLPVTTALLGAGHLWPPRAQLDRFARVAPTTTDPASLGPLHLGPPASPGHKPFDRAGENGHTITSRDAKPNPKMQRDLETPANGVSR